jgi:hypothetical protein
MNEKEQLNKVQRWATKHGSHDLTTEAMTELKAIVGGKMNIKEIRKRHKDNTGYIAKREKQGRWWWMDMHQICHDDRATLLDRVEELEAWAMARSNELGRQITKRDKRIAILRAEIETAKTAYADLLINSVNEIRQIKQENIDSNE